MFKERMLILCISVGFAIYTSSIAQTINDSTYSIELPDQAAGGGTVTLSLVPPGPSVTEIETEKDESAASVASRLANSANTNKAFRKWNHSTVISKERVINGLNGHEGCGLHVLGGTDTGLRIPPAPTSLSVSYDFEKDKIYIFWDNGQTTYTSLAAPTDGWPSWKMEPDRNGRTFSNVSQHSVLFPVDNFTVAVVGYWGNTPSNAAVMRLRVNRQEEVYLLPFTNGIAPNWQAFQTDSQDAVTKYMEGKHSAGGGKNRYQILKAEGKEEASAYCFGMHRKFFGLREGYRYKFGIRMKSTVMSKGSSCAVYCLPLKERNASFETASKLRGKESEIRKLFELTKETPWSEFTTGSTECPNILMPTGYETLLVWVELTGKGITKEEVAFDGVFLH